MALGLARFCLGKVPMEVWPDISTMLAAGRARELAFEIRQAHVVRPSVGVDGRRVAASVIAAIDQETTNARGSHFAERDLLRGICFG